MTKTHYSKLSVIIILTLSLLILASCQGQPRDFSSQNIMNPFVKNGLSYGIKEVESIFTKNQVPLETGARCLDGTPYAVYTFEGEIKDKFILYLEGGAMCMGKTLDETLKNCFSRSNSVLGSSQDSPDQLELGDIRTFLSSDPNVNPLYYQYSKAYLPYCDGTLFQGGKEQPVQIPGKDAQRIFFRGAQNFKSGVELLSGKFNIFAAQSLIVNGISAGGMGALLWSNYLYEKMENNSALQMIIDGAIIPKDFQMVPVLKMMTKYLLELVTQEVPISLTECLDAFQDEQSEKRNYKCLETAVASTFVKPPVFFFQSLYDTFSMKAVAGVMCAPDPRLPCNDILKTCETNMLKPINKLRHILENDAKAIAQNEKNGVWAIACSQHLFTMLDTRVMTSSNYTVPALYGKTALQAYESYLKGEERVFIDSAIYPENHACSAVFDSHITEDKLEVIEQTVNEPVTKKSKIVKYQFHETLADYGHGLQHISDQTLKMMGYSR